MNTQFLNNRKSGIGGSDIGAILGVSKFKTAVDVYLSKTTEQQEESNAEHLYWGHALEAPIIDRFQQETGLKIQPQPEIKRHPEHDFMLANADALIIDSQGNPEGILEIKTSSAYNTKEWGAEDSDNIPLAYIAQVQWYMAVFGLQYGYLAVLIGGNSYRHYRLERDQELIDLMIAKASAFWADLQQGIAPEPANSKDITKIFPQDTGEYVQADTETLATYNRLKTLKAQAVEIDSEITDCEEELKRKLANKSEMRFNDNILFTWKSKTSKRFDSKGFKKAFPEQYRQFQKETVSRVFILK